MKNCFAIMYLASFIVITYGCWTLASWLGWIVGGLSLLLLSVSGLLGIMAKEDGNKNHG